jgi:Zinc-ribbon like family
MFDVDRADLTRKTKVRLNKNNSHQSDSYHGRRAPQNRKAGGRQPDTEILPSMPSHFDVRCNYCNYAVGLKPPIGLPSPWLKDMKSVLACCPNCRKPLPRCAICMLSLGTLNPYMELKKERPANALQPPDDMSSLSNSPFAEWFTWCVRCKHGGHAHHMVGWFAKHEICPVSGCDCVCQFDGVKKLSRPALVALQQLKEEKTQ